MLPQHCRYSKTHEWIAVDGDTVTVGITDHAQDALGDITFVELPKTAATIGKGRECGVIESVKAASDLYAPVSGEVVAVNTELDSAPEAINQDPHGKGWLYRVKGVSAADIEELMDAAAYEAFLESEA